MSVNEKKEFRLVSFHCHKISVEPKDWTRHDPAGFHGRAHCDISITANGRREKAKEETSKQKKREKVKEIDYFKNRKELESLRLWI